MRREIKKKMVILGNRQPFSPEVRSLLREIEEKEWIGENLRLEGSNLTDSALDTILAGGFVLAGRVEDHLLIDRLRELKMWVYRFCDMQTTLSIDVLLRFYHVATGQEDGFRRSTPVLFAYRYNPLPPEEIPAAVDEQIRWTNRQEELENPFFKAAVLHNRLMEIYPFKTGNGIVARTATALYLAEQGFPPVVTGMDEQTYNDAVIGYLKRGDSAPLTHALTEAVLAKLSLMLRLTDVG